MFVAYSNYVTYTDKYIWLVGSCDVDSTRSALPPMQISYV